MVLGLTPGLTTSFVCAHIFIVFVLAGLIKKKIF
jgi:hypothetical protein